MSRRAFDTAFGPAFFEGLPACPGIYRVFDETGTIVYVGKAKNLRRRLAQYRNAKRRKAHRKMALIVKTGRRIEIEACADEASALRLELHLIQTLRPKLNVSNAFSFLYPFVGIRRDGAETRMLMTSQPDLFAGYELHGCYRSRKLSSLAFGALARLFDYVGDVKHEPLHRRLLTRQIRIKRLEGEWIPRVEAFFSGRSPELLSELCLALVEKSGARQRREQVSADIETLEKFWRREAARLRRLAQRSDAPYPIAQSTRDLLLLNERIHRAENARGDRSTG